MKCKFYRGPLHGQVRDVRDDLLFSGVCTVKSQRLPAYAYDPMEEFQFETVSYSVRMMNVTIGGHTYRAPAMHPDGSVFLEYDSPRRKR